MISAAIGLAACAAALSPLPSSFAVNRSGKLLLAVPPAAAMFAPDKGKFRIMVGGQQVGKEEFEIAQNGANWVARGVSELKTPEGATHVTGTLDLHADGTPAHYEWSTQGAKKASASIGFNGSTAVIDLRVDGSQPFAQQFTFNSQPIAILDNNLYHQYAVLARLYDWNKKGAQTFSVLVPQEMTPGSVTVDSLWPEKISTAKNWMNYGSRRKTSHSTSTWTSSASCEWMLPTPTLKSSATNSSTLATFEAVSAERASPLRSTLLYALTIFASALLLFQVQPLISKLILPWFGGVAAVWTVCLVFFQVVLLAGYFYAHVLTTRFSFRMQGGFMLESQRRVCWRFRFCQKLP